MLKTGEDLAAVLPVKKQAYIEGRLAGKSKRQAALDAGYGESMALHAAEKIETKDVREAFAALIREAVPPERIAQLIMEGMGAKETKFFSHEGVVQDTREVIAWSERRQYAELAAEYGGYHMPKKSDGCQGSGVILILPDAPEAVAVAKSETSSSRTPAQIEFFSATERHVLFHGNRGSGKSAAVLWKAIQTAYLVPGSRVAIFRKTWPELKRSVWDEMLKLPTDLYSD